MSLKRNLLFAVLIISVIGIILWIGLDAVMRGVTEPVRKTSPFHL